MTYTWPKNSERPGPEESPSTADRIAYEGKEAFQMLVWKVPSNPTFFDGVCYERNEQGKRRPTRDAETWMALNPQVQVGLGSFDESGNPLSIRWISQKRKETPP